MGRGANPNDDFYSYLLRQEDLESKLDLLDIVGPLTRDTVGRLREKLTPERVAQWRAEKIAKLQKQRDEIDRQLRRLGAD